MEFIIALLVGVVSLVGIIGLFNEILERLGYTEEYFHEKWKHTFLTDAEFEQMERNDRKRQLGL